MRTIAIIASFAMLTGGCANESGKPEAGGPKESAGGPLKNEGNFNIAALGDLMVTLEASHKDVLPGDSLALLVTVTNLSKHPVELEGRTNSAYHINVYKRKGNSVVLIDTYPKNTTPVDRVRTISPELPMPFNYNIRVPDAWPAGEPLVIEAQIEGAEGVAPSVVIQVRKMR